MQSIDNRRPPGPARHQPCVLREIFRMLADQHHRHFRERSFRFLGRYLHLRTIGDRLHKILSAALAHLAVEPKMRGKDDLSIYMWDSRLTGCMHPYRNLSGSPDDEDSIEVSEDNVKVSDSHGQWAAELDRMKYEIVGCMNLSGPRPLLHDFGKPLQTLISVWARDVGVPLIHAGMVALNNNGLILGGSGGAGKSTTALACTTAGFHFLGDDRIGLEARKSGFVGHSLYNSVLFDKGQLASFPVLKPHVVAPEHPSRERKPLVFLNAVDSYRFSASAPVRAVAILRVTDWRNSSFKRARPIDALRAIAPSSLILPVGPGNLGMRRLSELVQAVPCFWFKLGKDIDSVVTCANRILHEAGQ